MGIHFTPVTTIGCGLERVREMLPNVVSSEVSRAEIDPQAEICPLFSVPPQALGTVEASARAGFVCCPLFRVPVASLRIESLVERKLLRGSRLSNQSPA